MSVAARAKRIRIYVSEGERAGGKPVHLALVEYLRRENARGATVLRAVAGFGASGRISTADSAALERSLPLVVEWIDSPDRVERLLPGVRALVPGVTITAEDVEFLQGEVAAVRALPDALCARDVMTRDLFTVTPRTPLREVVEGLLAKNYRAVPVVVDGIPAGIITNTDLVERGGLAGRLELLAGMGRAAVEANLERLQVSRLLAGDVMTREPFVIGAGTRLPRVAEVMLQRKLKRLPVVDGGGKLVGMVSRVDLLRLVGGGEAAEEAHSGSAGLAADTPLARVMRKDMPTVGPDASLAEVCQAIVSTRLHRAVVVDGDGKAIGEITDAMLLERLAPPLQTRALGTLMHRAPLGNGEAGLPKARDLMDPDLATATEETPVAHAISRMLRGRHKLLAVVDRTGRLVGAVDRADMLRGVLAPAGGHD